MIGSPCKNCSKKHLPKDKCLKGCELLKEVQEMDSYSEKWNEGCGIDYTEVYSFHIPSSLVSSTY